MENTNRGSTLIRKCQWTGGTSKERHTCDKDVVHDKSYCPRHYTIVYDRIPESNVEEYIKETLDGIENTE